MPTESDDISGKKNAWQNNKSDDQTRQKKDELSIQMPDPTILEPILACGPPAIMLPTYEETTTSEEPQPPSYNDGRGVSPIIGPIFESPPVSMTPEPHTDENDHSYVGLVNQAMTCYLNSLLQTLYMTPEFRNALYTYQSAAKDEEKETSITTQLQKLFLLLQTSDQKALETKSLTKSFGWHNNEAYDQHDVQEFCRIMFDALESRWKNSENKHLIQSLYQGKVEDYVKCLNCNNERVKEDVYLDIPLTIKKYGMPKAFASIEQSLFDFTNVEILHGSNQYECLTCESKQDAQKGLRFTSDFPYILTFQIKRFDFDYNTMHRLKLNDRISFPDFLDMNKFLHKNRKERDESKVVEGGGENEIPLFTEPEEPTSDLYVPLAEREGKVQEFLKNGPNVYELFSVMVHQGNASGGHYYAYIKNLDKNQWSCFNDCNVVKAEFSDIYETFGNQGFRWGGSHSNAYMVMYRKVDPLKNEKFIRTLDLPQHLVDLQTQWIAEEKAATERQRILDSQITVQVKLNYDDWTPNELPILNTGQLYFLPTDLLDEVAIKLYEEFRRVNDPIRIPTLYTDNFKLIMCDGIAFHMLRFFSDEEMRTLTLADLDPNVLNEDIHRRPELFLMVDIKSPFYDNFMLDNTDCGKVSGTTINVVPVSFDNGPVVSISNALGPAQKVWVKNRTTIGEIRSMLNKMTGISMADALSGSKIRLVFECSTRMSYSSGQTELNFDLKDTDTVASLKTDLNSIPAIYGDFMLVGERTLKDRESPIATSMFAMLLQKRRHGKYVVVAFPTDHMRKSYGHSILSTLQDPDSQKEYETSLCNSSSRMESVYEDESNVSSSPSFTTSNSNIPTPVRSIVVSDCELDDSDYDHPYPEIPYSNKFEEGPYINHFDESMNLNDLDEPLLETIGDSKRIDDISHTNTRTINSMEIAVPVADQGHTTEYFHDLELIYEDRDNHKAKFYVDERMPIRHFHNALSTYFDIPEKCFNLFKVMEYENGDTKRHLIRNIESYRVGEHMDNVLHIDLVLCLDLQPNEEAINVRLFRPEADNIEAMETVFEVAISSEDDCSKILQKIHDKILLVHGKAFEKGALRLLKLERESFRKFDGFGHSSYQGNHYSHPKKEIFFQQLENIGSVDVVENNLSNKYDFVYICRWMPSQHAFGPVITLPVRKIYEEDSDEAESIEASLVKKRKLYLHKNSNLIDHFRVVGDIVKAHINMIDNIPIENVAFFHIKPQNYTERYPYKPSIESLLNGDEKFLDTLHSIDYAHVDGSFIYYTDITEKLKELSEDDLQKMKKNQNGYSKSMVRVERPLRIDQAVSFSES
uniref:USP domain-containing protein n=1 Tax=Rhabditophanes sp. KR3021 TaxID=114890 RepID=A0AC35TIW5_9BILA